MSWLEPLTKERLGQGTQLPDLQTPCLFNEIHPYLALTVYTICLANVPAPC